MIRIFKFAITLTALATACYFAFFVPLGSKTFYEHLKGISKTEEAQKFQHELKSKVKETTRDLSNEFQLRSRRFSATDKDLPKKDTRKSRDPESASSPPNNGIAENDKQAVLKIIRENALPSDEDRASLRQLVRDRIGGDNNL